MGYTELTYCCFNYYDVRYAHHHSGQNFQNPFDFIIHEETVHLNNPVPATVVKQTKKNPTISFSPY